MNIVFFGSSDFAVPSLKTLLACGHRLICVVTQPDRPKGRGLHPSGTAIKEIASKHGIRIYQPQDINAQNAIKLLQELKPDLFVVIAYGQLLSGAVLNIPKIFSINVHASLLPKYRGAAPINWAIIKGEKITGVTIMKMVIKMDAGPMLLQREINVKEDDTAVTLEDKLATVGAELLLESLSAIENESYNLQPQNENNVTYAHKLKKGDGRIDWNKPAYETCNLIRGCLPWPGAFTYYKGKLLKIYRARVTSSPVHQFTSSPGEIVQVFKEGIVVDTGKDSLAIEELQLEGKRRMAAADFITGHRIRVGEIFDKK